MEAKKQASPLQQARDKKNKKLYSILLSIYSFSQWEDLFALKSKPFLNLCEVAYIGWDLEKRIFKGTPLLKRNNPKHNTLSPYWLKHPLCHNKRHYGYLSFISSHKMNETKKRFLKKIADAVASSIYFIENKNKLENIKQEWSCTFDSFYQPLCITDSYFNILRTNQAFCQLVHSSKQNLIGKNIFYTCPISIQEPLKNKPDTFTWVSTGIYQKKPLNLQFTLKTIYLKNEKISFELVLVKDVTQEIKMEKMLAQKTKNKNLALIKGSIAHELNNPIAGIKTLVHVIDQNLPEKRPEWKEIFKNMDEALNRCQHIIENLLSISHQEPKDEELSIDLSL